MSNMDSKDNLENLYDVITGEKALRKKELDARKAKEEAIKSAKNKRRKSIVKGEAKLDKDTDDERNNKKIVQNIKLFEWEAPERFQVRYSSRGFLIIIVLCLLFILLLAIVEQYAMMAAIIAVLFLLYVNVDVRNHP